MISGPPHDEGHIDSVHCRLEADRQTMQGEGHPRRNSLSLARRRCWPGQSQGGRSSGASRLGSRRRNGRPRRGPASARHPVSRSSRALRHPARRCVRSCRASKAIIDAGALKIDESKEMAETALVKILIGSSTFAFAGRANAAPIECRESCRRVDHRGFDEQGVVTVGPVGCDAKPWPLSVSSKNRRSKTLGRTSRIRLQTPPSTSLRIPPTTSLNRERYYSPLLGFGQSLGIKPMPTFEH